MASGTSEEAINCCATRKRPSYPFLSYAPDPEWVETNGSEASLLKAELSTKTYPDVFQRYNSAQDIGKDLIYQLATYVHQESPFKLQVYKDEKPMEYQMRLQKDEDGALLAVSTQLLP